MPKNLTSKNILSDKKLQKIYNQALQQMAQQAQQSAPLQQALGAPSTTTTTAGTNSLNATAMQNAYNQQWGSAGGSAGTYNGNQWGGGMGQAIPTPGAFQPYQWGTAIPQEPLAPSHHLLCVTCEKGMALFIYRGESICKPCLTEKKKAKKELEQQLEKAL